MSAKVIALGFFDGVHLGHQAILRGADRAITFRSHPLALLAPERAPRLIMSLDDRLAAIRACGVREITLLDFTPELAATSPDDFAARYLTEDGAKASVRCGANWNFGKGGAGNPDWLRAHGYDVTVVPFAEYEGEPISSSRIRRALASGEIAAANVMMGRPLRAHGEVFRGKGAGRALGFPTVNLRLKDFSIDLPRGVYEVAAGGARGLANYGVAPTFGERQWKEPVLEIHFCGQGDGQGFGERSPRTPPMEGFLPLSSLNVDFLRFVRPERKFASVEALREQIARDCAGLSNMLYCAHGHENL